MRERLGHRCGFLIHGPRGVGKSLLLHRVLPEFPNVLYSGQSATAAAVFRNLAGGLVRRERIPKSSISLKGVVLDALRAGRYCVVLDHLERPSPAFAAAMREVVGWAATPVIAAAESIHMEHVGSLQPFFPDRADRLEIRNFDQATAERFLAAVIQREGLSAENMSAFEARAREFSRGNPGTIVSLVRMAKGASYRSHDHIKMAPLLIDFRLNGNAASAR